MAAEDSRAGRLIGGRYRLLSRLAAGGFGRVWRARDEALRVDVAIKEVWLPPSASPAEHAERLARAEREARNAAALREHPNIVPVYDIVIDSDEPWMVMRLIAGRSLGERLAAEGPLDEARAREVATALLTALGAVHAAGITHRDVKPANVMLADSGEVLLTDFGIAVHEADERMTESGMVIGTREYLSPERVRGEIGGAPSDLFSLGVTLYRAVEGISPFRRELAEAAYHAIQFEDPPPMKRAGALEPLITALLAKDPARRPGVPAALAMLTEPPPERDTAEETLTDTPPPGQGPQKASNGAAVGTALGIVAVLVVLYGTNTPFANFVNANLGLSTTTTTTPTTTTTTSRSVVPQGGTTFRTTTTTTTTTTSRSIPTSTTGFDPRSLDRQETDRTPITLDGLLPRQFTDSKNVLYTRRAGGVHSCVGNSERDAVRTVLRQAGCSNMITGSYVDSSDRILVTVQVIPVPTAEQASTAHAALRSTNNGDWSIWCPTEGVGSTVCKQSTAKAVQSGYVGSTHRYVRRSFAVYINLNTNPASQPWVTAAANKAIDVIGPQQR